MKKESLKHFLVLQCSTLFLLLTLLPEFDVVSMLTGIDFNIANYLCKLIGVGGIVYGLLKLRALPQEEGVVLTPVHLGLYGGGALLGFLSMIPSIPDALTYIGLILLLVAFFMGKKDLFKGWASVAAGGASTLLYASIITTYNGINDILATKIAAIVALILFFMGLSKMVQGQDAAVVKGCGKLKTAAILSIIAIVVNLLPLVGGVISGILLIIAFVMEYLGYSAMKASTSLGELGRKGAGSLCVSMILLLVSEVLDFIPFFGMVVTLLAFVAVLMVFKGWINIVLGIESEKPQA